MWELWVSQPQGYKQDIAGPAPHLLYGGVDKEEIPSSPLPTTCHSQETWPWDQESRRIAPATPEGVSAGEPSLFLAFWEVVLMRERCSLPSVIPHHLLQAEDLVLGS